MTLNIKFFIVLFSCITKTFADDMISNNCISFTIPPNIECSRMWEYCEISLGTSNIYFTDGACNYHPHLGFTDIVEEHKQYTCCSI